MAREGRLGFPRPFGNILREYRPLIPDMPVKVGKIASAIDDGYGKKVGITNIQENTYSIDFVMDIRGADEFSRSSLQFNDEGDFIGGMIRAGTVVAEGTRNKGEILDEWNSLLTDEVNLNMSEDDVDIMLRENDNKITPHVFFTTRRAGASGKESPIPTNHLLRIIDKIGDAWHDRFKDYSVSGRSSAVTSTTGNVATEDESVDDMMDHL